MPRPAVRGTQGPEPVLSRLHCHEPPGDVLSLNTEASDVNTRFQLMFENQCSDHSHWESRLVPMKAEEYGTMIPEKWGSIVKEYELQ